MTTICKFLQVLGVAALLTALALSLPTGAVHAEPKATSAQQDCQNRGFTGTRRWDSVKTISATPLRGRPCPAPSGRPMV